MSDSLNPFHLPKFEEFELINELHDGFSGPTALMLHKGTNLFYICKTFHRSFLGSPEQTKHFLRRINRVKSYNFVFHTAYTKIIETEDAIYCFRQYLDCPNLLEFLSQKRLDNTKTFELWRAVAQCFVYLHDSGIFPNPIKPTNIFIINGRYVALTDLYEITSDLSLTLKTPSMEHIQLLAPEFFSSEIPPSSSADVWSLGALLLVMCEYPLPWANNPMKLLNIGDMGMKLDESMPYEILHVAKYALQIDSSRRPTIPLLLLPCLPPKMTEDKKKNQRSMKQLKYSGQALLSCNQNIHSATSIHSSAEKLLPKNCSFRCRLAPQEIGVAKVRKNSGPAAQMPSQSLGAMIVPGGGSCSVDGRVRFASDSGGMFSSSLSSSSDNDIC